MSSNKKNPSAWRGRNNFWKKSRGGWQGQQKTSTGTVTGTATGLSNIVSPVVSPLPVPIGQYEGWKLYFYDESFKKDSPTDTRVKACLDFIVRHSHLYNVTEIEVRRCYLVDVHVLSNDQIFINNMWKTFIQDLSNDPQHTINCLGLAMHHFIISEWKKELEISSMELRVIRARVYNFEPILQLRNFKTQHHDNTSIRREAHHPHILYQY
uniref:DNA helicase MCM8 n=1 Tax=Cacopsylla melanoneura TaxID=428564 RepID=A0A8D8QL72_9HEMI